MRRFCLIVENAEASLCGVWSSKRRPNRYLITYGSVGGMRSFSSGSMSTASRAAMRTRGDELRQQRVGLERVRLALDGAHAGPLPALAITSHVVDTVRQ
jgi:hypothetical protein